ncbi:MAG: M56 family metallopeptidase, partial [Bdellovibrionales bacterium]|nr:M56 family metallopeptidase [Bdellovibrionales bacterium]
MSEIINTYLTIQTLLSLSFFLLWIVPQRLKLNFSSLLKLAYFLMGLTFISPLLLGMTISKNPFGPVVKVWSEPVASSNTFSGTDQTTMGIKFETIPLSHSWSFASNDSILAILIFLTACFLLLQFFKFFKALWQLHQKTKDSFLFRKIGRVHIWLNEHTSAPFSFHNGSAHIILPTNLIENSENFKISVLHEIQHHRQRDTLWVYSFESIKIFFGINPLVKKLISQITEFQELACDEVLIGHKNISPHAYGKCLLDFAEQQLSRPQHLIGAVGIVEKTSTITRRINTMFQHKKSLST